MHLRRVNLPHRAGYLNEAQVATRVAFSGRRSHGRSMEFTIQYFGRFDRMLGIESVNADELDEVLNRARSILKTIEVTPDDLELMGYVILDHRGRQVARGYRR